MAFPSGLDFDRVLAETLNTVQVAITGWQKGGLHSEEPLMSRLSEQFSRPRRGCDVGSSVPMRMTSQVALLHRKGDNNRDKYGADLAITVFIEPAGFLKTALFQLKVSEDFTAKFERAQLNDALADAKTGDRTFVLVADRTRLRTRVNDAAGVRAMFNGDAATLTRNCADWNTLGQWLSKWLACEVGLPSTSNDANGVEPLLSQYIVERADQTDAWQEPWPTGQAPSSQSVRLDVKPAKMWLMLFFSAAGAGKENAG